MATFTFPFGSDAIYVVHNADDSVTFKHRYDPTLSWPFADGAVVKFADTPEMTLVVGRADPSQTDTTPLAGAQSDYAFSALPLGRMLVTRPGDATFAKLLVGIEELAFGSQTVAVKDIVLRGTTGDDQLYGTPGSDIVVGLAGDDTVVGSPGNDFFYGNDRDAQGLGIAETADPPPNNGVWYDRELGGQGVTVNLQTGVARDTYGNTDTLFNLREVAGSQWNDVITGDDNNNIIRPYAGNDRIDGGGGRDEIHYGTDSRLTRVEIDLASGVVKKYLNNQTYTDTLSNIENIRGSRSADDLKGDDGANRIRGLGGADTIDGRGGIDIADYSEDQRYPGGTNGIVADLATREIKDGYGTIDTVTNIENVYGTRYADSIAGDGGDNLFRGLGSNDTIDGRAGTDTAEYLGRREDYSVARQADGSIAVRDLRASSPDGTDTLISIENLKFSDQTVDAGLFQYVDPAPPPATTPPTTTPPPSTPAQISGAVDAVLPGLVSPAIDALKEKLAAGTITFEQLVDGLVQEAQSSTIPALVVANVLGGATPSKEHLAELTTFAQVQYEAYVEKGVANPALGSYEALGAGFSETAEFKAKYGNPPPDVFLTSAYQDVFGRGATQAQFEHFQKQLDYFNTIYRQAGLTQAESLIKAKGAIVGQMMGHAVLDDPSSSLGGAANGFLKSAVTGTAQYGEPLALI